MKFDPGRLGDLILLRYRLQWAAIRNSPGGIVATAILLSLFALLLVGSAIAGIGIGLAGPADRAGRITRIVLGVMFVNLLIVPVMLGYGMAQAFSARTLRQYPLARAERLLIQYGLGLVEPMWILAFALYAGCAAGAWALGVAPLWQGMPAAVLLVVANYATARLILALIGRLLATQAGSFVLVGLMQAFFLVPLAVQYARIDTLPQGMLRLADLTPPFAAAALMTATATLAAPVVLLAWCAAPAAILLLLDAYPPPARRTANAAIQWDTLLDRIAAFFPGVWEPLVGRTLRYYLRSPRVRINLVIMLPLMAFFVAGGVGGRDDSTPLLDRAVLFAPVGAMLVTAGFTINAFGYDGAGLRRLLLCPVPPGTILRVLAAVPAAIGVASLWVALAAWTLLAPGGPDARALVLVFAHGCTGMLLLHALGFWSSILAPKRVSYDQKFRDDASFGGQVTLVFAFLVILIVPTVVRLLALRGPLEQYWWVALVALAVVLAIHLLMLAGAQRLLPGRRERLLSVVEGRG